MRTFDYTEKGRRNDPRKPAGTYDMLRKNIATYAMFILALFREKDQHYLGVWLICRIMNYRENNTYPFTKNYCRKIMWAIVVNRV